MNNTPSNPQAPGRGQYGPGGNGTRRLLPLTVWLCADTASTTTGKDNHNNETAPNPFCSRHRQAVGALAGPKSQASATCWNAQQPSSLCRTAAATRSTTPAAGATASSSAAGSPTWPPTSTSEATPPWTTPSTATGHPPDRTPAADGRGRPRAPLRSTNPPLCGASKNAVMSRKPRRSFLADVTAG
jgi:hypothetical protein